MSEEDQSAAAPAAAPAASPAADPASAPAAAAPAAAPAAAAPAAAPAAAAPAPAPAAASASDAVSRVSEEASSRQRADPVRFFVGGLPPEAEDQDLHSHFSQYGALNEACVIRERDTGASRKFGFIMLKDGRKAKQLLDDDHTIRGRRITVKLHADSKLDVSAPSERNEDEVRKVFIGRLEPEFTKELLRERFQERFGRVSEIFLAATSKFGFITFESSKAAQAALDAKEMEIDGKSIVIKDAEPIRSGSSRDDDRDDRPPIYGYGAPPMGYSAYGAYGAYGMPSAYGYAAPGYSPYGYPPAYGSYPPPAYGSYPPGYPTASAYGAYGYPGYPAYYGPAAMSAPPSQPALPY